MLHPYSEHMKPGCAHDMHALMLLCLSTAYPRYKNHAYFPRTQSLWSFLLTLESPKLSQSLAFQINHSYC